MLLLLLIPIGLLCLVLALLCWQVRRPRQALSFGLVGGSCLGLAALLVYGGQWLLTELSQYF